MALTILQVGYPLARVSSDGPRGATLALARIDEALVDRGHRSIVIAPQGSSCRGALVPLPSPGAPLDHAAKARAWQGTLSAIERALDRFPVDLVHMHGPDFERYLPGPGVPVLATLHLWPSAYSAGVFEIARPGTYLNCTSAAQRAACPAGATLLDDVPSGALSAARMIEGYLDLYLRLVRADRCARLLGPVFAGLRC